VRSHIIIKLLFSLLQVSSIKSGMWDSIYDTFLAISQQELTNTPMQNQSEYEIIDVEPSVKDAPVIAEHCVEVTHGEYCLLLKIGFCLILCFLFNCQLVCKILGSLPPPPPPRQQRKKKEKKTTTKRDLHGPYDLATYFDIILNSKILLNL
jgi:hypothetical protein